MSIPGGVWMSWARANSYSCSMEDIVTAANTIAIVAVVAKFLWWWLIGAQPPQMPNIQKWYRYKYQKIVPLYS